MRIRNALRAAGLTALMGCESDKTVTGVNDR